MSASPSVLCLEDYADATKRWLVETDSLALTEPEITPLSEPTARNPQGFLSSRTLGLVKRFRTLIAVFTDGKTLKLALAGNVFDLMDGNARAYTKTLFPFAKSFTLERNGEVAFRCSYWFAERDDLWPENDIFALVARLAADDKCKRRFLLVWNDRTAGEDVTRPELLKKLELLQ
jgi:hypothetical protein